MSDENTQADAPPVETAAPQNLQEAMAVMPPATLRKLRLARLAGVHALVWLVAVSLFAATESWALLSDLGFAWFLAVVSGALAGLVTTNLIHEWFHMLGARVSGGEYDIPDKLGLFVYDWKFQRNSTGQFFTMSIAGSVGGLVSLILVWNVLPPETLGRAAVFGGTLAGFVFGAVIEWPVLRRVRFGGEPLAELSKIDGQVLGTAFVAASLAGVAILYSIAP